MKDNIAFVPVAKRRAMQVPKNLKLRRKKFSALDEMIEDLCYRTSLVSVRERAHGIAYMEPLLTGWKPPLKIKRMSKRKCDKIRKRRHIVPRKSILDVIQEVEYVKQEAKTIFLLECLQKTPPPVLIFCDNKADVDDIHEYLLSKGLEAVAIHVGKDQEEREYAISSFKAGQKDVLVATDVASKELDFPDIQHVINFDMPNDFVRYVERIGRTGRCGKTGIATTFISKNLRETLLLDLKHLLKGTKQRIPPVLAELHEKMEDVEANWM